MESFEMEKGSPHFHSNQRRRERAAVFPLLLIAQKRKDTEIGLQPLPRLVEISCIQQARGSLSMVAWLSNCLGLVTNLFPRRKLSAMILPLVIRFFHEGKLRVEQNSLRMSCLSSINKKLHVACQLFFTFQDRQISRRY